MPGHSPAGHAHQHHFAHACRVRGAGRRAANVRTYVFAAASAPTWSMLGFTITSSKWMVGNAHQVVMVFLSVGR
jgi:hypothetical protein